MASIWQSIQMCAAMWASCRHTYTPKPLNYSKWLWLEIATVTCDCYKCTNTPQEGEWGKENGKKTERRNMTLQSEAKQRHRKYALEKVWHEMLCNIRNAISFAFCLKAMRSMAALRHIFHFSCISTKVNRLNGIVPLNWSFATMHCVCGPRASLIPFHLVSFAAEKYATQFHMLNNGLKLEVVHSSSVIHWYFSFILHFSSFHYIHSLELVLSHNVMLFILVCICISLDAECGFHSSQLKYFCHKAKEMWKICRQRMCQFPTEAAFHMDETHSAIVPSFFLSVVKLVAVQNGCSSVSLQLQWYFENVAQHSYWSGWNVFDLL